MKKFITAICIVSIMTLGMTTFASADSNSAADAAAGANAQIGDVTVNMPTDTSRAVTAPTFNRQYVNPGITPLPQTNGFFTAPTPDSSFRSIKDFLNTMVEQGTYGFRMTDGALENLAKGGDVTPHIQVIRGPEDVPRVYGPDFKDDPKNPRWLWVGIEKPIIVNGELVGTEKIKGLTVTGMIDGEAGDGDTNSLQVLGKVGLKALADGDNYMVLTAEGAHRKVEASGWGVGLYLSGGDIASNGLTSSIVGGGTGYSQNETGPEDRPWVQGYVGCKPDPKLEAQIAEFNAEQEKK